MDLQLFQFVLSYLNLCLRGTLFFFFPKFKELVEFRNNEHFIVVDLVHFISLPMTSMTSHGLSSEIKIYLTAIQIQHILGFITNF